MHVHYRCKLFIRSVELFVVIGSCFVRTDQLDGETDWKLRVAVTLCQQQLQSDQVSIDNALSITTHV